MSRATPQHTTSGRREAPPHGARPLDEPLRWLLRAFAALAFTAGVLLFVGSEDTEDWWSWTIDPPLTAAFLGASYWAAFVLLVWASLQHAWARVRPTVPPVAVIAVLLLVATVIHWDRFDRDSLFGLFWIAAYIAVPLVMALLVARQLRMRGADEERGPALHAPLRVLLVVQGAAMLAVGGALFVDPEGSASLWPWTLTPLTGRAIGAFVFGFGVSAAHAAVENDASRFRGSALAYLALGVLQLLALALHSGDLQGEGPEDTLYIAFLFSVVGAALYGLVRASPAPDSSAPSASSRS